MKVQVFLRAESLPPPSSFMRRKMLNTFAVISNVSDVGTIMGIKRYRVGATEVVPTTSSPEWATMTVVDHDPSGPEQRLAIDIFHTTATNTAAVAVAKNDIQAHDIHDIRYQGKEHRGMPIPKDAKPVTHLLFSINEVLQQPDWTMSKPVPKSNIPNSKVVIHIEPVKHGREDDDETSLHFQIRGYSFPDLRRTFIEKPDYYYEIFRKVSAPTTRQIVGEDGTVLAVDRDRWRLVYRSQSDKGMLSPMWAEDYLSIAALCNHDLNRELAFQVVDMDRLGVRHRLGGFETNVHGLMGAVVVDGGNCDTSKAFQVMCMKGEKKMGQMIVLQADIHTSGSNVFIEDAVAVPVMDNDDGSSLEIMAPPAQAIEILAAPIMQSRGISYFQDYATNCDVDLCMAIDFTDGNGQMSDSSSAHARKGDGGRLNDYEWSISVVTETLRDLNTAHEYPMWGFGGCFNNTTQSHPIFQCGATPKANGTKGLLQAYGTTFKTGLTPGRQRTFNNILMAAAHHAKKQLEESRRTQRRLSYTLLTILTVGSDSDILAAKDKLVAIQGAPLSVLFVRIPPPSSRSSSSWSADSFAKLQMFTSDRNCRRFYTCLDDGSIANRDAKKLSAKVMQVVQEQMPAYFQSQGM